MHQLDEYLLVNYPTIWQTRVHYVFPFILLTSTLLFAAGFLYPVSLKNLNVHPIHSIHILQENYFIFSGFFALLGIMIWASNQHQTFDKSAGVQKNTIVCMLYFICLCFVWFISSNAFRMGMLVQTAYDLMDERDIDYLEKNDFFTYGFIMKNEDWLGENIDFVKREQAFRDYRKEEDEGILRNRYDTLYQRYTLNQKDKSYRSYLSNQLYLSNLSYQSYLFNKYGLDRGYNNDFFSYIYDFNYRIYRPINSYHSYHSYQSYLLKLWYLPSLPNPPNPPNPNPSGLSSHGLSYLYNQAGLSALSVLSALSDVPDVPDVPDLHDYWLDILKQWNPFVQVQVDYADFYSSKNHPTFTFDSLTQNYGLIIQDTVIYQKGEQTITFPKHTYTLEYGVRSVKHARQYLERGILFEKGKIFLGLALLSTFLLFIAPYFSRQYLLPSIFFTFIIAFFLKTQGVPFITYELIIGIGTLYLLVWFIFSQKKKNKWRHLFIQLLLVVNFEILIFSVFGDSDKLFHEFISSEMTLYMVPIISICISILIPYIEFRPNSE